MFSKVTGTGAMNDTFYVLTGRILKFEELSYGSERKAVVEIWFEFIDMKTRDSLVSKSISVSQPIAGKTVDDIIKSMSLATKQVLAQCAKEIERVI